MQQSGGTKKKTSKELKDFKHIKELQSRLNFLRQKRFDLEYTKQIQNDKKNDSKKRYDGNLTYDF